ncbi:PE-PPE domain-containing protein [Mycolicibacterium sp. CH28]|uniref:PE-PPE domain-containing protein n=1 Tax=Mycolicibacterium sp. CH28 TaxID=2512237 RepID=UPI001F46A9F4|nr:PE-PPE domain-containing protein [Mycolicibacterium sp. CH28]
MGAAASVVVAATVVGVASMVSPISTFVAIAGTTVLVMGGTGSPLSTPPDTLQYVHDFTSAAVNNFVSPASSAGSGIAGGPYNSVAVITPEENAPRYGSLTLLESIAQGLDSLNSCVTSTTCDYNEDTGSAAPSPADTFVVFGYSQSATIAMLEKRQLAAEYAPGEGPNVTFVVVGNSRPNGGLVARDPQGVFTSLVLGLSRDDLATDPAPTHTQYATVDIALQYDLFADAPLNPLNLLAVVNAYMGVLELHPNYTDYSLNQPGVVDQGQYGDTHYYLIPARILPILMPLANFGTLGHALADTLDAPLRVIIESAYNRNISPGVPTPWNVLYFPNPVKLLTDLAISIPTGLDNGIQDLFGVRPFATTRPEPFGVGGGSAVETTTSETAASSTSTASALSSAGSGSSSAAAKDTGLGRNKRSASSTSVTARGNSERSSGSSSRRPSSASERRGVASSKRAS